VASSFDGFQPQPHLAFFGNAEPRGPKRKPRSDPPSLPTDKLLATLLGPAAERVCEQLTDTYGGPSALGEIDPGLLVKIEPPGAAWIVKNRRRAAKPGTYGGAVSTAGMNVSVR
jgi:hypothetical protein